MKSLLRSYDVIVFGSVKSVTRSPSWNECSWWNVCGCDTAKVGNPVEGVIRSRYQRTGEGNAEWEDWVLSVKVNSDSARVNCSYESCLINPIAIPSPGHTHDNWCQNWVDWIDAYWIKPQWLQTRADIYTLIVLWLPRHLFTQNISDRSWIIIVKKFTLLL